MGYKSFRDVYHKLAIVIDNGYCFDTFNMMQEKIVPEGIQVNSALVYGYIDKMCGFSYKVLGLTYYEDGDYTLMWPNDEVGLTVRGECFKAFELIPIENKALLKRYESIEAERIPTRKGSERQWRQAFVLRPPERPSGLE